MPPLIQKALSTALSGLQFGVENSGVAVWVVGGLLAVLSIYCWAAMVGKNRLLRRANRANQEFMRRFRDSPHPLTMYLTREHVDLSPFYHIYHAASRELAFYLVGEEEPGRNFSSRLQGAGRISVTQMDCVQNAMAHAATEAAIRLELRLSNIAAVLAVAPFLGLLGTVWGLIDNMALLASEGQTQGWQAVAPGIAAALLTTLLALVLIIPCVMSYHGVISKVRAMIARMDNFARELSSVFDRQFVEHRTSGTALPSLAAMGAPSMTGFAGAPPPTTTPTSSRVSLSEVQ